MTDDQHDEDVMALVDQLMALEYQRGQLRERLLFHLRIRDVAVADLTVPAPAPAPVSAPAPSVVTMPRAPRHHPGELEEAVITQLRRGTKRIARIAKALDVKGDSVRQVVLRLLAHARVRQVGRGQYELVPPQPVEGVS